MRVKLLDPNGVTLVGYVEVPVIVKAPDCIRYNHGVFVLQSEYSWESSFVPEYQEGIMVTVYKLEGE